MQYLVKYMSMLHTMCAETSCLLPLVYDQSGSLTERLPAVRAHVRLLPGVDPLVQRQVAFLHEAFTARSEIT